MMKTSSMTLLIKLIDSILEKGTEIDENGIEYFKDITIQACELQDLHNVVKSIKKEMSDGKTERMWEIYSKIVSSPSGRHETQTAYLTAKHAVDTFDEASKEH